MSNLEIAKQIVNENFSNADCGIFDCRSWTGDDMTTLYDKDGLVVDICYYYSYFEVFGLTEKEFKELEEFYEELRRRKYER